MRSNFRSRDRKPYLPMNCIFEEIEKPATNGKRRVRCRVCGLTLNPTGSPLEQIHAACKDNTPRPMDPGEALSKLIRELRVKFNCKACAALAKKMKACGVDGCRIHRAEIVQAVRSRIGEVSWLTVAAAALRAAFSFRIDLADPIGSLVDEAIRRAEQSQWITVPQPPSLELSPKSDRAIVTVAVGAEAVAMLAITRTYMEAYAERLGADFVALDWPGHPAWPMSSKFAVARTLDHYERIAFIDADVLLRPGCVDVFSQCNPHEFGILNEADSHRRMPHFRVLEGYQAFRSSMGFPERPDLPYLNTGVMVIPRSHQRVLLPPTVPIRISHIAEQDWIQSQLVDSGLPYVFLDRRCNWQHWTDHNFSEAPTDAILHWSGMKQGRVDSIRKWAEHFPLDFDPWSIDARHRDWLYYEMLTGKYRRVLEIGSHKGYSTQAFLDALAAGAVDEVHLCELEPTPELLSLIDGKPGITLHRCPSVELLERDSRWDLVFVDGDHQPETCLREAEILIAAKVPAVFAHDTSADPVKYPGCEGPPLAKRVYEAAGYCLEEDARNRPGERTDRGMLLATLTMAVD